MSIYETKNYKLLLIIPVIMLAGMFYFSTQVKFGIEFRGGILITVPLQTDVDTEALRISILAEFDIEDLEVRKTTGALTGLFLEFTGERSLLSAQVALEAGDYATVIGISKNFIGDLGLTGELSDQADAYYSRAREQFKNDLVLFLSSETGASTESFSVRDVGPSLGSFFLSQAQTALIAAFILIGILIFYYFKTPIVSFAVIQSAVFDAFLGYAALGAFGIPLSLATVAPILMLIGYSVDTDIMLTDRMLKRKEGTPATRANGAVKTGLTMTGAALGAMVVLLVISTYSNIEILRNISLVMVVGLLGDIVATWCTNTSIVLWYLERKAKKYKKYE